MDLKKKAVEDAEFSLDSLRHTMETDIDRLEASFDQKDVQMKGLESDLASMKQKLGKSYIRSGSIVCDIADGVVYDIGYVQGDSVSHEKKLLSIMDLDSTIVEANIPEEFIKDINVGAAAEITPQADKSRKYTGKVLSISDKAVLKNGETTVPVRISIDNRDDFLLPDFNVDVSINIEKKITDTSVYRG